VQEGNDNNKLKWTHWLIVLAPAVALRLFAGIWFTGHPVFQKYLTLALQLNDQAGHEPFFSSPLYTLWLACLVRLIGVQVDLFRWIQLAFGIMSVVLIVLIGVKMWGRKAGMLAGLLYGCWGAGITYECDLVTASLFILVSLLTLYCFITALDVEPLGVTSGASCTVSPPRLTSRTLWYRVDKRIWLVLCGVLLGLGIGIRPNLLLLIPIMAGFIVWNNGSRGQQIRKVTMFISGVFLVIAPITIENYLRSGEFILVTASGGSVFYSSNNYRASGIGYSPPTALTQIENKHQVSGEIKTPVEHRAFKFLADRAAGRNLTYREMSSMYFNEGVRFLVRNGLSSIKVWGQKFWAFFNRYEVYDTASLISANQLLETRLPFLLGFGFISILGLVGLIKMCGKNRNFWILIAFLTPYLMTGIVFYVNGRLRAPAVPCLALLGAAGIFKVWEEVRNKDYRGWVSIALIIGAGVFVSLETTAITHHRDVENPSFYYTMRGVGAMHAKALEKAILEFEKAVAVNPFGAREASANLSMLYHMAGNQGKASQAKKMAGGLWDMKDLKRISHESIRNSFEYRMAMGVAMWRSGDIDGARQQFQKVHVDYPHHPDPAYNLALAEVQQSAPDWQVVLGYVNLALDFGMKFAFESTQAHDLRVRCLHHLGLQKEAQRAQYQVIWEKSRIF